MRWPSGGSEGQGDVFMGMGLREEAGCGVLYVLKFIECFGWCPIKNAIAVVYS